ncbi:PREDICTED: proline-rich protein 2-like [Charadrius vociferus]|uniref:proline-rich protein 2-like n=1 Tax=Charadrius vociferus TaxID=50402 RepID=UPI000521BF6E|nr:PREDICTED: proline-rich protein 2-like [Charadrius vociferus]
MAHRFIHGLPERRCRPSPEPRRDTAAAPGRRPDLREGKEDRPFPAPAARSGSPPRREARSAGSSPAAAARHRVLWPSPLGAAGARPTNGGPPRPRGDPRRCPGKAARPPGREGRPPFPGSRRPLRLTAQAGGPERRFEPRCRRPAPGALALASRGSRGSAHKRRAPPPPGGPPPLPREGGPTSGKGRKTALSRLPPPAPAHRPGGRPGAPVRAPLPPPGTGCSGPRLSGQPGLGPQPAAPLAQVGESAGRAPAGGSGSVPGLRWDCCVR